MTDNVKEIRNILVGRTTLAEDGRIRAIEKGEFYLASGVADGAGSVRFLGITRRAAAYETELPERKVMQIADTCMMNIGRRVALKEQPETAACLIRYVMTRPVLLVFKYVDGEPVLTAWSGAGISGLISILRGVSAFEKQLPEDITRSGEEAPDKVLEKEERKRLFRKKKKGEETPGETADTETKEKPEEEESPSEEKQTETPDTVPDEDPDEESDIPVEREVHE